MEQENSSPTVQPEQAGNVFTRVTPLSKYLAMALFVAMPFIGGWVGYMYAPEKIVHTEKMNEDGRVVEAETNVAERMKEIRVVNYTPNDVPACTNMSSLSFKVQDISDWVDSTGTYDLYFKTKHPSYISIDRNTSEGGVSTFSINDTQTGLSASVKVFKLEDEIFKFGGLNLPVYTYELNSDTVWSNSHRVGNTQCIPEQANYMEDGKLVMVTGGGDVGAWKATYNIIMKPTPEQYTAYDGNRPVAVSISFGGDSNDPSYKSEDYDRFRHTLEQMIREMVLMPVHKG